MVQNTGLGGLNIRLSAAFVNLPAGTYEFESDGGIFTDDSTPQTFANLGTLRKNAGANTSAISISFSNQGGSIEVDSGTLSLGRSSYAQGSGSFTVQLGGTNAGQSGMLAAGVVTLSGPLNLKLAAGFVPQVGAQFQVVSASSLTGTFSSLNVPSGITISYSGNGVVATVTSPVGNRQIVNPGMSQPTLVISRVADYQATLQWEGSTNFVVESASSLEASAPWLAVTNIPMTLTSNSFNVKLPITNAAQYFRLRQQ